MELDCDGASAGEGAGDGGADTDTTVTIVIITIIRATEPLGGGPIIDFNPVVAFFIGIVPFNIQTVECEGDCLSS